MNEEATPVRVVILGRFGSPKAQFINAAPTPAGTEVETATNAKDIRSKWVVVSGRKFQLIDTPGFDDPEQSNVEVFEKLSNYLLDQRLHAGVTGIVYIHCASDSPKSRVLRQAMNVLSDVVLGRSCLPRLTILVVPMGAGNPQHSDLVAAEMETLVYSTFRPALDDKIRTMVSSLEVADVINVLTWYTAKDPIQLRIQRDPPRNLRGQIEASLGYYEAESVKLLLEREKGAASCRHHPQIPQLESFLVEKKPATRDYEAISHRLEHDLAREREEAHALRQQLQQTQTECASLRTQLQFREGIELQGIVDGLMDLNRKIEYIGHSFAAHLVDNFVRTTFDKDPGDVTTLDARQLPKLKELFSHVDGQSSLVVSSHGAGLLIKDFLGFAIRQLLCSHLCRWIFRPFHPGAKPAHNETIAIIYDKIQIQEPQLISAKWRAQCFKSIYQPSTLDVTTHHIDKITNDFFDTSFSALAVFLLGNEDGLRKEQEQLNLLRQLVQSAWDWSATLKGDVILLGNFYQTYYDPHTPFEPCWHEELEPRSGVKVDSILGTMALGLISTQSVGGGNPPEGTVVCKAVVATESIYD